MAYGLVWKESGNVIITVTMNPAIDKTVEIDCLQQGGLNRISKVEYDAGGKGINVSKTIFELGGKALQQDFWQEMQDVLLKMYLMKKVYRMILYG